jgi:hypothetical protein
MLGKTQALASSPYQVYGGPQTAGASSLQNKVFQGLGSLNFPSNLGQSFASPMGQPQQPPVFNPATMIGGPGAMPPGGSDLYSPQVMPQQGPRGFNQGPRTEADWNRFSSMAMFTPGADMAKIKADFLAGGQGGGPGAMPPMGESSVGSVGYAAPETGGVAAYGGGMRIPLPPGYNTGTAPAPQQGIAGLTPPQTSQQPSSIAQSYMNPYLESVLSPQMAELRRQNEITNMATNAKLTGAGAFGGSRQALMNAENNRNLMTEQNKTVGQGYANAFDKAMGQFNTEQTQAKDLANMMAAQGGTERDIEQQGITSDYNEFLAQRDYPQKQLQFMQSMLQGLPISTVSNQAASQSGIGQLSSTIGGLGNIIESLKKLGLG